MIFDDAIMYDSNTIVAGMRMGIVLARRSMRGPTGMRNPPISLHLLLRDQFGQHTDPANAAHALQTSLCRIMLHHGESGRIITAVFEPPQPIQNDGNGLTLADVADDSTHGA